MEHAQAPRGEIVEPARERLERAVGEPGGDRVDAEVAPRQVLAQRDAELDLRQRTRALVALPAGGGDVDLADGRGGAEAVVQHRVLAEPPRDGRGVALHHEIEVARLAADQRVADRAADDPDARHVGQRVEHRRRPGQVAQPLQQVVRAHTATIAAHVVAG